MGFVMDTLAEGDYSEVAWLIGCMRHGQRTLTASAWKDLDLETTLHRLEAYEQALVWQ